MTFLFSIGSLFITICCRICLNDKNKLFRNVGTKRLIWECLICHILMLIACFNFIQ